MRMDKLTSRFQQALSDAQSLEPRGEFFHAHGSVLNPMTAGLTRDSGFMRPERRDSSVPAPQIQSLTQINEAMRPLRPSRRCE